MSQVSVPVTATALKYPSTVNHPWDGYLERPTEDCNPDWLPNPPTRPWRVNRRVGHGAKHESTTHVDPKMITARAEANCDLILKIDKAITFMFLTTCEVERRVLRDRIAEWEKEIAHNSFVTKMRIRAATLPSVELRSKQYVEAARIANDIARETGTRI